MPRWTSVEGCPWATDTDTFLLVAETWRSRRARGPGDRSIESVRTGSRSRSPAEHSTNRPGRASSDTIGTCAIHAQMPIRTRPLRSVQASGRASASPREAAVPSCVSGHCVAQCRARSTPVFDSATVAAPQHRAPPAGALDARGRSPTQLVALADLERCGCRAFTPLHGERRRWDAVGARWTRHRLGHRVWSGFPPPTLIENGPVPGAAFGLAVLMHSERARASASDSCPRAAQRGTFGEWCWRVGGQPFLSREPHLGIRRSESEGCALALGSVEPAARWRAIASASAVLVLTAAAAVLEARFRFPPWSRRARRRASCQ